MAAPKVIDDHVAKGDDGLVLVHLGGRGGGVCCYNTSIEGVITVVDRGMTLRGWRGCVVLT